MPHVPGREAVSLIIRAQMALGLTQEQVGARLGASRRTVSRWIGHQSSPTIDHLTTLARIVHSTDAALAAQLAAEAGQTLQSLGLVQPMPRFEPPPAASPHPPAPPPRAVPPVALLVESIVCAAAETLQVAPSGVREALRSAFARARGLGLTVEEVDAALSPPAAVPTAIQAKQKRA
jgi:transcriptional regulator with XRE-family HTH domain